MAKGQERSNREAKKPKADKKKVPRVGRHCAGSTRKTEARRRESGDQEIEDGFRRAWASKGHA